jgi:class 3 adenylate cyclase/tetratricopeptide (TPR) repeat protein
MRCPACQHDNAPTARFCAECGQKFAPRCSQCGAEVGASAKFCDQCGAALTAHGLPALERPAPLADQRFASPQSYTPNHLAEKILKGRSALVGERKQVTVLFADVSGFTALSEKLDPEEVHRLMNRAFELMLEEIHRFEGTVNQFLGDGLMALFGAPIAHEDHAQGAVRAALGMQRALRAYRDQLMRERGIEFKVRLGLNTGLVVVGAIGDNLRMDYTAVGDTTNLAARMQQLAEPGQIVLAEATHRLVHGYFETRSLGSVTVKNRQEPVTAYEALRARGLLTRLDVQAERGLTPFVGREQELAMLERAFTQAREGHGQVVFLVGEAGMGKSRLLLEFRQRLVSSEGGFAPLPSLPPGRVTRAKPAFGAENIEAGDRVTGSSPYSDRPLAGTGPVTWVEGRCISFGGAIAHLPIIDMLKRNFRLEDTDSEPEIIAKVNRGLAFLEKDSERVAPFLKYLLSVDPGDPGVVAMDPHERRARIFEALRLITVRGSRLRPIVMVIEDLHWIDNASEEFLKFMAESLAGARLLLMLTYRPGYQQPLGDRTYHSRISLQPLNEAESIRIASGALETSDLPAEVRALITRKAEGNPFFMEEIVRSLLETGALKRANGGYVLARTAGDLFVPDTIQDLITARIDRLDEGKKRTIQVAAVIGREFALRLLRRTLDLGERLENCLAELKSLEFIYEKAFFPDLEYAFKHALTHDVAYASILRRERRTLHAAIGAAIEEVYAERIEERVEELAHHFLQGEVWEKAVHYLRQAGAKAVALCVDREAMELYERALQALDHWPESPEKLTRALDLRLELRAPLWRSGKLDRLFALFQQAEELAQRLGDPRRLDKIYAFLVQYYWAMGEYARAIEYGERCLAAAETFDDLTLRVTGNLYLGHAYESRGDFPKAVEYLVRNMDLLEGERAFDRFGLSGLPYVVSCAWAVDSLAELGEFDRGLVYASRGARVAEAADHPYSFAAIRTAEGYLRARRGEHVTAIALLEPALETCRSKNFAGWIMRSATALGIAYAYAGRIAEAIPLHQEAIRLQEAAGAFTERSSWWANLAEAHLLSGQVEKARQAGEEALKFATAHGERGREAWARWVLGAATARKELLLEAIGLAESLGMRPLLGRCLLSLGQLYAKLGSGDRAAESFRKAAELFRAMGMPVLLEQALSEVQLS